MRHFTFSNTVACYSNELYLIVATTDELLSDGDSKRSCDDDGMEGKEALKRSERQYRQGEGTMVGGSGIAVNMSHRYLMSSSAKELRGCVFTLLPDKRWVLRRDAARDPAGLQTFQLHGPCFRQITISRLNFPERENEKFALWVTTVASVLFSCISVVPSSWSWDPDVVRRCL